MNKSESKYFNTATIATPPMLLIILYYIIQELQLKENTLYTVLKYCH